MKYDHIIVLGTGVLFLKCLGWLKEKEISYTGYDTSGTFSKTTMAQVKKKELNCQWKPKSQVFSDIRSRDGQTLMLSVINPWIIPADILEQDKLLALNCHQALLPAHKGRNAEAWAVYEGDTVSGITWHRMRADVDAGEILDQRRVPITEETTSWTLFRAQLEAAFESFEEFMPLVLEGKESYRPQETAGSGMHYAREIPEEGRLNPLWEGARISRFLRAMDYGGLKVLGQPVITIEGKDFRFGSYKIRRAEEIRDENPVIREDTIVIRRPGYEFTFVKCRPMAEQNI